MAPNPASGVAVPGGAVRAGWVDARESTPLTMRVLGQIFRSRQQIRDLAERLLERHMEDVKTIEGIIDFLCSDSGSHDYTINRREALALGLNIEKPSEKFYKILRKVHDSYSEQMELTTAFDLVGMVAPGQTTNYEFARAMIESPKFGAHHFRTEGTVVSTQLQQPQQGAPGVPQVSVQDHRQFDGWKKVV